MTTTFEMTPGWLPFYPDPSVPRFEVPPGSLKPGPYVCQVNVVDEAAERFAFPRLELYVR